MPRWGSWVASYSYDAESLEGQAYRQQHSWSSLLLTLQQPVTGALLLASLGNRGVVHAYSCKHSSGNQSIGAGTRALRPGASRPFYSALKANPVHQSCTSDTLYTRMKFFR